MARYISLSAGRSVSVGGTNVRPRSIDTVRGRMDSDDKNYIRLPADGGNVQLRGPRDGNTGCHKRLFGPEAKTNDEATVDWTPSGECRNYGMTYCVSSETGRQMNDVKTDWQTRQMHQRNADK